MKHISRILTLVLCLFLAFTFTACSSSSASDGAVGENAVGENAVGGGLSNDGSINSEHGDLPSDLIGNWAVLPEDVYSSFNSLSMLEKCDQLFYVGTYSITADGSFGAYYSYGEFESSGYVLPTKSGFALYYEGSEEEPLIFQQDSKNVFVHTPEDGETCYLVRLTDHYPKTDLTSPELIGAWEGQIGYDENSKQRWLVTRSDATWYTVDADGNVVDEGYILSDDSLNNNMLLLRNEGYFDVVCVNSDGSLESRLFGEHAPVDAVPGGSYTPDYSAVYKKYAGYWQYSSNNIGIEPICVLIREDGTYTVIDNTDTIRSEGKLKTTKAGVVTIPLDGTQEVTYYPDEDGMLVSEDYDRLIHLNGSRDPASPLISTLKDLMVINEHATEWYSFTEDAAWHLRDNYGNTLDSGTVLVDPDDENTVVLISDSGKYPRILNDSEFVNDGTTDEYGRLNGYPMTAVELDDIPSYARFVGLWCFNHPSLSNINILFSPNYYYGGIFRLTGYEVNADNSISDERRYEIMPDPSTGALTFYADNGRSTLVIPVTVSADGSLITTDTNETLLASVDPGAYLDSNNTCIRSNG